MKPDVLTSVKVCSPEHPNGLGMMMEQYLKQNLSESEEKVNQALLLRSSVAVEVEKGTAVTLSFSGKTISIENGASRTADLYLRSSFLILAGILSGTANPFYELLRGNIKLGAIPKKPLQSLKILRFLKIPPKMKCRICI